MSYRPPSHPPQGRWARWLHEMRRARDWSQQQAFEELHVGLGLGQKSRASYIKIDMGPRPPNVRQQEYLVGYFGQTPDDPIVVAPTGDRDELAAAIYALVEEMRLQRTSSMSPAAEAQRNEALEEVRRRGLTRESSAPTPLRRPKVGR